MEKKKIKATLTADIKRLKRYRERLLKMGRRFHLTPEDLSNLTDLRYMVGNDTYETLKLNNMADWFQRFFDRVERITLPELNTRKYRKEKEEKNKEKKEKAT